MIGFVHQSVARLRALTLLVLAAIMTLRALVPLGFMVGGIAPDGAIVLELCGGQSSDHRLVFDPATGTSMLVDADDLPISDDTGESCPFALSATVDLPSPLMLSGVPAPLGRDVPQLPIGDAGPSSLSSVPPPARGPPVLA